MKKDVRERWLFAKSLLDKNDAILIKYFNRAKSHRLKGRIDPVTIADKENESHWTVNILRRFPNDQIIAEEGLSFQGSNDFCWLIDPLDGTVNYLHNYPLFCSSIALMVAGEFQFAFISAPVLRERFHAVKNGGAFLNGRRIRVSQITRPLHSLFVTGFPYSCSRSNKPNLDAFSYFTGRVQGIRRSGSAALDLAYVAAGRAEVFWEPELKPYDMAAGALLVTEAQGIVSDYNGDSRYLEEGHIIAGNKHLHKYVMRKIQQLKVSRM